LHEIKHDGFRTLLAVERGDARAFTRNGHDWSDCYPRLVAAASKLACRSALETGKQRFWRGLVSVICRRRLVCLLLSPEQPWPPPTLIDVLRQLLPRFGKLCPVSPDLLAISRPCLPSALSSARATVVGFRHFTATWWISA
jgi:hypothetical protein